MDKQTVLIIGASGHSKVILDIFEKTGAYQVLGLLDDAKKTGDEILGYKVIGNDEDLPVLIAAHPGCKLFVAIGDNWLRKKVVDKILAIVPAAEFTSAIHPSVQIGINVEIGKGVAVMAGAIINSDTRIGDFVIVNTKTSIDHDCRISEFVSLGPNVTLGGGVKAGAYSAIAMSATVKHGVHIGKHAVIGAGALLLRDCEDNTVMYGVPAEKLRLRDIGETYL